MGKLANSGILVLTDSRDSHSCNHLEWSDGCDTLISILDIIQSAAIEWQFCIAKSLQVFFARSCTKEPPWSKQT
jgi:hypothetical protein